VVIVHVGEWPSVSFELIAEDICPNTSDGVIHIEGLSGTPPFSSSLDGVGFQPEGPVLVRRGAHVHAFTRLVGPCLIAEDVVVNGGRISGSSIGERSRVAGEVSSSIFLGHANKAHDGFIGHSVLGRWVNLGASTVNSNLKNTYGDVSLWTPHGNEPTGLQFLGTFFGDHAKTAIGTRLTTGTVIGAGANVFGSGATPKYVAPFSWGVDDPVAWELDAFLRTAERVMSRRQVALTDKVRRQLGVAWRMSQGVTS
jgi:UDP-N-acetylglucosamine diphosphorylase/glucosamine-1-phosphate N-acetyltransferase